MSKSYFWYNESMKTLKIICTCLLLNGTTRKVKRTHMAGIHGSYYLLLAELEQRRVERLTWRLGRIATETESHAGAWPLDPSVMGHWGSDAISFLPWLRSFQPFHTDELEVGSGGGGRRAGSPG